MNRKGIVKRLLTSIALTLCLFSPNVAGQEPAVKLWEEPLVIPTYRVGEPDKNPIFYGGRAYQGARGSV